ncbi:pentatricopeptide repeat-containing protein At5g24830 [Jatropha curcas]|nr:pentatricopeptide repeat-containing protein At5g24830 [Jatropha curcas]
MWATFEASKKVQNHPPFSSNAAEGERPREGGLSLGRRTDTTCSKNIDGFFPLVVEEDYSETLKEEKMAALLISSGESASSHIFLLRLFDRTVDTIKQNAAQIFSNIFFREPIVDPNTRHGGSYSIDNLMEALSHRCQLRTQDWFQNKREDNGEGDPQFVFNVLDAMLKGNLERLKSMREGILSVKVDLTGYVADVTYVRHAAVIREFCLVGKLGTALWLRRKMVQIGFVPDVLTHNYLVNGLCKTGELEKADWIIREMLEIGPSPNCATYNTFIKGYCLRNDVDKALFLFSTMTNSGIRPNRVTLNILVHALCKSGLLDDAKKLLREIIDDNETARIDIITSTILMDGCIKNGDMTQALGIWDALSQKNVDAISYNVIIHGFCLIQDLKLAYSYSCEMLKRGLLPDVFTYNTLISGLCQAGKIYEACYIHDVMLRMGVAPDHISYKMVIHGLCTKGDVFKANEYLNFMLKKSMVPEPFVWNLIIGSYGRCGDPDNAFSIRDQMLSFGVVPNVFTYNALIHAQVKVGNVVAAYYLKKEMDCHGLFLDVVTYNLLISAACNAGQISVATRFYNEMLKTGCEPDLITYTELIGGFCKSGNMKEAEELLSKLQNSGLTVDHVPFQILIKKYCTMRETDMAFDLYKKWLTLKRRAFH